MSVSMQLTGTSTWTRSDTGRCECMGSHADAWLALVESVDIEELLKDVGSLVMVILE